MTRYNKKLAAVDSCEIRINISILTFPSSFFALVHVGLKGARKREKTQSRTKIATMRTFKIRLFKVRRGEVGEGKGGEGQRISSRSSSVAARVLSIPPSPALSLFIGASLITPSFYNVREKLIFLQSAPILSHIQK